jgi:hypothetical protein
MEDHQTGSLWKNRRLEALVVACSDGRFHDELDEFIRLHLAICCYDRLYVPGGGGALATGGVDFLRAQRLRSECKFLIRAHELERVVLFFHGPATDGPAEAVCGDYRRRLPTSTIQAVRLQQERDAKQILCEGLGEAVHLEVFFCEVDKEHFVRFRSLES